MRHLSSLSILLTLFLLFLTPSLAVAIYSSDATEIPYQINNSDRIVIGTVSGIDTYNDYTITTITVNEWLYNPLPTKTIQVMTTVGLEDEAEFTQNESMLLMLNDKRLDKHVFLMFAGSLGKRPVSDRDEVVEELMVQGKWKGEDQTGNLSTAEEVNNGKVNNSSNITSDNGSSSGESKSIAINPTPGFGLLGSLACLYGEWKLRRE
jgi:hypothetical protein